MFIVTILRAIGRFTVTMAEAVAEAQAMRRQMRRRYPAIDY
ncbi:hypothetical protein [Chelatococcus composti]|jgi:hypothetical protein|uniref:Uncharacterized protein n=1 Tax=Chelatococcus composti TaxID=1743235 RepID=A0A841KFV2_9HYPH|nr:hypothetical protein [Chelatococcus composti]MBB6168119.1 hypothetical protein [Chelatococcus composti]GGG33390.1 hypothetical protein GCM10008026_12590 [Chelatococcus composti]